MASITKVSASLPLLMKMVDEGKLNIDDSLSVHLDLDTSDKGGLIIRDILAHQSRPGKKDFTSTLGHSRELGRLLGRNVK